MQHNTETIQKEFIGIFGDITKSFENNLSNLSVKQLQRKICVCTTNPMSGRAIWDKLPKCIFGNLEIGRLKQGQFQIFQKSRG